MDMFEDHKIKNILVELGILNSNLPTYQEALLVKITCELIVPLQQEIKTLKEKLIKTSFVIVDQKSEIEGLKADKWISVDDRLPEDCNMVLIFTKYGTKYIACYVDTTNQWVSGKLEWEGSDVTYWQPLPDKPEGLSGYEIKQDMKTIEALDKYVLKKDRIIKCPDCNGSGISHCNYQHSEGIDVCLKCKRCPDCNGSGKVKGEVE